MRERSVSVPTIYSAGYQGMDHGKLIAFVKDRGLMVADLRLKPVSWNRLWNKTALSGLLGVRYVWIEALGNLNYKGGPIVLKDSKAGLKALRGLLRHMPVVALCVCADPMVCHRTKVISLLKKEMADLDVVTLSSVVINRDTTLRAKHSETRSWDREGMS